MNDPASPRRTLSRIAPRRPAQTPPECAERIDNAAMRSRMSSWFARAYLLAHARARAHDVPLRGENALRLGDATVSALISDFRRIGLMPILGELVDADFTLHGVD